VSTLAEILRGIEKGVFPAPDAGITVVPAPSPDESAVLGVTGHIVIAADVDPAWIAARVSPGDLSAPFNPPFLRDLEELTGRRVNAIDALLLADPLSGPGEPGPGGSAGLVEVTDRDHPRVRRALRYRDDVRVFTAPSGGVVVTGRGLAGRWECAVEIPDEARGSGEGRRLARAARALVDEPLWAQITPGNAASLRAFLAAGYRPVGSEALLVD
jgi:RimJ/RimL family protein N-acetyltransferase